MFVLLGVLVLLALLLIACAITAEITESRKATLRVERPAYYVGAHGVNEHGEPVRMVEVGGPGSGYMAAIPMREWRGQR
jgi:hypothetical protein